MQYYPHQHRLNVNVIVVNIAFLWLLLF